MTQTPPIDSALQRAYTHTGQHPIQVLPLPASGSQRAYYRLQYDKSSSLLLALNANKAENRQFVEQSHILLQAGAPVPRIYTFFPDESGYLLEDLGDGSLLQQRQNLHTDEQIRHLYAPVLADLFRLQTDWGLQIPVEQLAAPTHFDAMAMGWDLAYFKYWLLLPSRLTFDEYALELDFRRLLQHLSATAADYWLFRDFQARNVLPSPYADAAKPFYYIDYQSSKRGAMQYDLASLLYQARAELSPNLRDTLLADYCALVATNLPDIDINAWQSDYYRFVLLRQLQVLGAYGFRGFYERKPHFLQSMRPALANIEALLQTQGALFADLPQLQKLLWGLVEARERLCAVV